MELVITLLIGAVAGWLGSQIFKGSSLGLIGNIIAGILGSFVGSWALGMAGISLGSGLMSAILTGALGAIIILAILNLLFNAK